MHLSIDNLDIRFLQQLNKRLELLIDHIKTIKSNSYVINNRLIQIRINLHQRYEIRNNYYHRKYPLLRHDLCLIKSTKQSFQLTEKHSHQSIQFYKKTFNISSSINIESHNHQLEQSNKYLNELKNTVHQYQSDIDQLKQELINQTKQINIYSNNLFQIQYEQNQIQSDIKQLKQNILFEKQLHHQLINSEYNNLLTQITEIIFNIQQKTLLNLNQTRSLLSPTTNTEEINKLDENIIKSIPKSKKTHGD